MFAYSSPLKASKSSIIATSSTEYILAFYGMDNETKSKLCRKHLYECIFFSCSKLSPALDGLDSHVDCSWLSSSEQGEIIL